MELVGPEVAVAVWGIDVAEDGGDPNAVPEIAALHGVERTAIGRAVEKRRIEFARGRACARSALVAAGGESVAIPVGASREPIFPEGFVGSITHCDGFVAAAVARAVRSGGRPAPRGIGVDAERVTLLEDGVLDMVVTDFERAEVPEAHWSQPEAGCVLFSAKEAVFKAVFPLVGVWIGFEDVGLTLSGSSFGVGWTSDAVDVPELGRVEGRWTVVGDLVLTACRLA